MGNIDDVTVEREYTQAINNYTKNLDEFRLAIEKASQPSDVFVSARALYESLFSFRNIMKNKATKFEQDIEKIKKVSKLCILAKNLIEDNKLISVNKEIFINHLNNEIVAHISLNTFFKEGFRAIALSAIPLAIAAGLLAVSITLNFPLGLCFFNEIIAGIIGTIGLFSLAIGVEISVKKGFDLDENRPILRKNAYNYSYSFFENSNAKIIQFQDSGLNLSSDKKISA